MRRVWIWSLAIGGVIALSLLVLLATGPGHADLLYNADVALLVAGVVLMHRDLKRHDSRRLTYRSAVATGAGATLIVGLISRLNFFCM